MECRSVAYWAKQAASVDSIMGGFGSLHAVDIKECSRFIAKVDKRLNRNKLYQNKKHRHRQKAKSQAEGGWGRSRVAEFGGGIGRVTGALLLKHFDHVDFYEPVASLLDHARKSLPGDKVTFHAQTMQEWEPEEGAYDCVWLQWCVMYLSNEELLAFLQKVKAALARGGVVVLRDNASEDEEDDTCHFESDGSVARAMETWYDVLSRAGFRVLLAETDPHFPNHVCPIVTFALLAETEASQTLTEAVGTPVQEPVT